VARDILDFDLTVDTQAAGIYSAVFGFAYDGQGNLVKMTLPNGDYTLYYFGNYEIHYSAGGSKNSAITYYPAGGAMRVETWLPVFPSYVSEVFYVLSDHLGSTSVVTDASGGNPIYTGYYPFGETRYTTGSLYTDRLYTGQQQVAAIAQHPVGRAVQLQGPVLSLPAMRCVWPGSLEIRPTFG